MGELARTLARPLRRKLNLSAPNRGHLRLTIEGESVLSYIEPISDARAEYLRRELHRHRDGQRSGRCGICLQPNCLGARQARAELRMAGRYE
ncbi:hypothetical protein GCM10009661_21890 [Catellatospora chokoriensis]|uniref:Uncharacterized protein n=1 Tax=Catellatospora chokoriensis TaxID=310353 RepID=A0A8J3JY60_9ACTN|nr:hypothetical protein Cch02nite_27700 [Catellatospora chokoriensis]